MPSFEQYLRSQNGTSEDMARALGESYFRLNVDEGLQRASLAGWDMLGDVKVHREAYLKKTDVECDGTEVV